MITIEIKKSGEMSPVERTDQIADYSLSLGTTKEAATGRLLVRQYGSKYIPEGEDEVSIYDGSDKIFGGFIVRVVQRAQQGPEIIYDCELKDFTHRLDYKLVNISIEGETAHDAIDQIVSSFSGPGITTTHVEDDTAAVISSMFFDNVPVSVAIEQIADLFGKEWYIDPDGDIHFFSKFNELAPFNITQDNGKAIFDSISIVRDFTQIRNSILVEGGEEKSTAEEFDAFTGNGVQYTFSLSRKYTGLEVELDSTPLSVGIANINSFDDFDCLYDFNLRALLFDPASPPADGSEIVAGGKYFFPILVRFREAGSVATFGERQFFIQDKSIKSRSDAISRASAELTAYAAALREGGFDTYESGLRAGQVIRITSALRDLDEQFIIQRLNGRFHTPQKMFWSVEIVSVKTYELIDLLSQIIKSSRQATSQDAVIGVAERVDREIVFERDLLSYLNDPPIWVAGPWSPVSLADRRRMPFCDRTCLVS